MSVTIYAPRRNFLINAPKQTRGTAVQMEILGQQILWDNGTDVQWDTTDKILWSINTTYPISIAAKRRSFDIISPAR